MFKDNAKFKIDGVAVFLLGAVFLFLSIGLVVLGGSVYNNIVATSNHNDELRTTLSYMSNQLRRADMEQGVEIGELNGEPAILLHQFYDGYEYIVYLYCWDGMLREQFVEKGYEQDLEFGVGIIAVEQLDFSLTEGGLLQVDVEFASGNGGQLLLAPRSGVEGGLS